MTIDSPQRIHELVERQAAAYPDGIGIVHGEQQPMSWRLFSDAINEVATFLRCAGVIPGDRVLIIAENAMSTAVFIFAASKAGAIAVPVNARMSAPEIEAIKLHVSPRVVVFTVAASEAAVDHANAMQAEVLELWYGNVALVTLSDAEAVSDNEVGDTAVILYTTGTTGAPKGVMLTHGNLLFAGQASADARQLKREDLVYGVLPLTHVFGLASMLMAGATVGSCIQLETRFNPEKVYAALINDVTVFPAVPQMHALVLDYARENGLNNVQGGKLRYVSSGAAPLDPSWKRKAEAFYGIALQNGFGMTESTAGVSTTNNAIGSADISVGCPLPGVEVKISLPVNNNESRPEGEILTRGPHVMFGYFKNPQATDLALDADGFLHTGDIGWVDKTGLLHISGRSKELIIRGGFNVFPPEVESALNGHSDVVQSAVIGRALQSGDEEILAFVQRANDSDLSEASLKAFVAKRLTAYKCPTQIVFVERLPAAATGKILKHRLLSLFADELAEA